MVKGKLLKVKILVFMNKILYFRRDNELLNIKFSKNIEECKIFVKIKTVPTECYKILKKILLWWLIYLFEELFFSFFV